MPTFPRPRVTVKDPDDQREFNAQVAAEPDLYTLITKAYEPKVIIENEIFPHVHEIYNCTNCTRAEPEHPAYKLKDTERYRIKCKEFLVYSTGPRWNDIGCPRFDRKIRVDIDGI
jgi:hypothetical protein